MGRRNLILIAVIAVILGVSAFPLTRGGGGGVNGGVPPDDVDRRDSGAPQGPADFQEQVDAYEAVFRAISDEEYFTGVFAFGYGYWDLQEKSAGIRGKPAEDVWVRWNEILTK